MVTNFDNYWIKQEHKIISMIQFKQSACITNLDQHQFHRLCSV